MSYFSELLNALAGRSQAAAPAGAPDDQARLAALDMDVRERDQRIAAMRKEYAHLAAAGQTAAAGQEQLQALFKKLAAPLSNLAALAALCEAGQEVAAADVVTLFRSVEKQLKAAGLEQVGAAGESVPFDVALHQRMSGGMVSAGAVVVIRTPGYRFAGKVLLKAMVTAKETAHG
jgi:molecular chaperone GrpE (heat shock protein)